MARYTGPKARISRRFNEPILGDSKAFQKKNYPPGQHGKTKKRKQSEYAVQLAEKQKAKYIYGVLERQFSHTFDRATRKKGVTGEVLLQLLESRLDNMVYRPWYRTYTSCCPSARRAPAHFSEWRSSKYSFLFIEAR